MNQAKDERTGEMKLKMMAKVGNRMNCEVTVMENLKMKFGPVMMTRMMPPPELQQIERNLQQLLENLNGISKTGR